MLPWGWSWLTVLILWPIPQCHHEIHICAFSGMCQKLLGGKSTHSCLLLRMKPTDWWSPGFLSSDAIGSKPHLVQNHKTWITTKYTTYSVVLLASFWTTQAWDFWKRAGGLRSLTLCETSKKVSVHTFSGEFELLLFISPWKHQIHPLLESVFYDLWIKCLLWWYHLSL